MARATANSPGLESADFGEAAKIDKFDTNHETMAARTELGRKLNGLVKNKATQSSHRSMPGTSPTPAEIAAIYNQNVLPDLKVTWGTYPNNLGHTDYPECLRCHDGSHSTSDQKVSITQDCSTLREPRG